MLESKCSERKVFFQFLSKELQERKEKKNSSGGMIMGCLLLLPSTDNSHFLYFKKHPALSTPVMYSMTHFHSIWAFI